MSGRPIAQWLDLSEPFDVTATVYPTLLPPTTLEPFTGVGDGKPHVSVFTTTTHSGTHMDAPRHFFADAAGIDTISLDRLCGTACVKRLEVTALAAINADTLEAAPPEMESGQILFVSTGWEAHRGTPDYDRHPYFTDDAADWIVAKQAALFGVDVITPEMPIEHRPPGHALGVHARILGAGIPIIEQLRLSAVAGRHAEVFAFPIAIVGGDGAPVRVAARLTSG